jgi:hypothetical protein
LPKRTQESDWISEALQNPTGVDEVYTSQPSQSIFRLAEEAKSLGF